jgi:CheY-like chemotaxis protein
MERRGLVILLLEDQENDVILVRRAVTKVSGNHRLRAVSNGEEAIQYLSGTGLEDQFPLPDVILTDLKMPMMNGLEFLRWRRDSPRWSMVPTIALSGSGLENDIREAYRLGATSYFTKPNDPTELAQVLRIIFEYRTTAAHV